MVALSKTKIGLRSVVVLHFALLSNNFLIKYMNDAELFDSLFPIIP